MKKQTTKKLKAPFGFISQNAFLKDLGAVPVQCSHDRQWSICLTVSVSGETSNVVGLLLQVVTLLLRKIQKKVTFPSGKANW